MAIVSFERIAAGRTVSGQKGSRRYEVKYRVVVDSHTDGPGVIGGSGYCPGLYTAYSGYESHDGGVTPYSDPDALMIDFNIEQASDDWRVWHATFVFDTNWAEQRDRQPPTQIPTEFWVETEFIEEEVTKDIGGNDILNSAGLPITGLKRLFAVETWVWEKPYTSIDRSVWLQYQNAVNSDSFYGLTPGQGLMSIVVPKASYNEGVPYWLVQFRVRINNGPTGWRVRPIDKGTLVKDDVSGTSLVPPKVGNEVVDGEVNLNGSGKMLAQGAALVYLAEKKLYNELPFNGLGL